jgi:2-dehydro-3-deoxyphosphooctonate aldolase (KDO 8-P synthase)
MLTTLAHALPHFRNTNSGQFFLMAGPCVIEGEDMALRIAERVKHITDKLQIPYIFKGSYRKANRSRHRRRNGTAHLAKSRARNRRAHRHRHP